MVLSSKLKSIVPFSGGCDSCFGLHSGVEELGMKPVTCIYDWGMLTDLGRRNISQMCGCNPLEITQFNTGFLGILPDFEEDEAHTSGARGRWSVTSKRCKAILQSPGYFNRSLWDTPSGEYHRSFTEKIITGGTKVR